MEIKKCTLVDLPVIAKLAEVIWYEHYSSILSENQIAFMLNKMYSLEALSTQLSDGHCFYLLYSESIPLAYASVSKKEPYAYFLHKFYVDTSQHRKGLGTFLFDFILNDIKAVKTLYLTVNRQNFKAINFYFKKGFVIEKVEDFDIGNGYYMNDFVMVKKINEN